MVGAVQWERSAGETPAHELVASPGNGLGLQEQAGFPGELVVRLHATFLVLWPVYLQLRRDFLGSAACISLTM